MAGDPGECCRAGHSRAARASLRCQGAEQSQAEALGALGLCRRHFSAAGGDGEPERSCYCWSSPERIRLPTKFSIYMYLGTRNFFVMRQKTQPLPSISSYWYFWVPQMVSVRRDGCPSLADRVPSLKSYYVQTSQRSKKKQKSKRVVRYNFL